jgi:hypothetical protein
MNMETNMQYLETDTQRGITVVEQPPGAMTLTVLIDRAATALAEAKTAAEVLDARDMASVAYDMAKKAARFAAARQAHDDLISAIYRARADALTIEAQAKCRLADEYDAAQARGEINSHGGNRKTDDFKFENSKLEEIKPIELHEARLTRDAEVAEPGIIQRTVDAAVAAGEEPTKAKVRRAVKKAAKRGKPKKKPAEPFVKETQHDRDLRVLIMLWNVSCESARAEFLKTISFN